MVVRQTISIGGPKTEKRKMPFLTMRNRVGGGLLKNKKKNFMAETVTCPINFSPSFASRIPKRFKTSTAHKNRGAKEKSEPG